MKNVAKHFQHRAKVLRQDAADLEESCAFGDSTAQELKARTLASAATYETCAKFIESALKNQAKRKARA